MNIQSNILLEKFTSFNSGGPAETLITFDHTDSDEDLARIFTSSTVRSLGFGTNVLVSDKGIPGVTAIIRQGSATIDQETSIIADAGMWWDDLVQLAISHNLWGVELMSGIPSSIGGAVAGNIAAYGQQTSDRLEWIEVFNATTGNSERILAGDIDFGYRSSSLQSQPELVIKKVKLNLSHNPTTELEYESALSVARELGRNSDDLTDRRAIILEARRRAGSLYDPTDPHRSHTAGSFFKNPKTDIETATRIAAFDESGKSLERILKQNQIHGGDSARVSAAHVLLAAGFTRGQAWGPVRLHPDHVLKIENAGGATSQQIYDVAREIQETVKAKLGIDLEPEVKFLGDFTT